MKRSRASWCVAIGVAGAVHGAVFWAAITSWSGPSKAWVEPAVVTLVSIQGGLAAVEKGTAEPAPAPEKLKAAVVAETPPVPSNIPPPPAQVPPSVAQPATIEPAEAVHTSAVSASDSPASALPIRSVLHPKPPQRAGEATGPNVNAPRGKSQDYGAVLRAWLELHKTYPKHARMRRDEGVVQIRFAVDRQGRLLDGAIVRSSGVASLDKEALAMLDRCNPFPVAPHTMRGERIELQAPVAFYLR